MSDPSKKRNGEKYYPGTSKMIKDYVYDDKEQQRETTDEFMERIQKNDKSIQETKKRIKILLYNGDEKEKPKYEHDEYEDKEQQQETMEELTERIQERDKIIKKTKKIIENLLFDGNK